MKQLRFDILLETMPAARRHGLLTSDKNKNNQIILHILLTQSVNKLSKLKPKPQLLLKYYQKETRHKN